MSKARIDVLIVDDTGVTRMHLCHLLSADPQIRVIGTAADGQSALDFLRTAAQRPDVILMDIHMPRLDGFETTRRIMETHPLPIIICTATSDPQELAIAFRTMEAGAVACIEKPSGAANRASEQQVRNLLETVRVMSEVKVVRRWPRLRSAPVASPDGSEHPPGDADGVRFVGIGASTGGPVVLQTILAGLPKDFAAPLLIVQHIARGFLPGLVEWLNQTTGLHVQIAAHGIHALPGHAYIAPDDLHLGAAPGGRIVLAHAEPEGGLRPAVSYLFRSLATTCGASAIGVLLTGMGKDGAAELKQMKQRGACTIVQDRDSSIVHGMPGEAIGLGAATFVLPADRIAGALLTHVKQKNASSGGGVR